MIYIKELLPNPSGKDTAGEWIALFNDGGGGINLRGWIVKDASGKKFIFGSQELLSNQELKLPYATTRINLNNDGDTITLYDDQGKVIDELSYTGPVTDEEIITSSKFTPPREDAEIANTLLSLEDSDFTGQIISAEQVNPLLIGFGLALVFGIGTAILTKRLINPE